tara:strand:- start:1157 stop:2167 length:1011 start_codon:yes stop_codon:yes gene_type:complete
MPRIGRHPLKEKSIKKPQINPKEITITTIVYIPSTNDYWSNSFDILKLFFDSLLKNTQPVYDLMVFDNGSCKKIIEYLIDLRDKGIIQYLILSEKNHRKLGALNYLLQSAPGKYISYADSDVFFLPEWLDKSLDILESFPKAGKVTALPIVGGDTTVIARQSYLEALNDENINVQTGKIVKDKYILAHLKSLGREFEDLSSNDRKDTLLIKKETNALLSTADFQFTIKVDAVKDVLPLAITSDKDYYDPIYSPILEKKLDENGWWQLSTMDYLIHHMGNQIPDFEAELPWVKNFDSNSYNNIKLFKQKSKKIAIQSTFIRKIIKKVHTWSYQKLYG